MEERFGKKGKKREKKQQVGKKKNSQVKATKFMRIEIIIYE